MAKQKKDNTLVKNDWDKLVQKLAELEDIQPDKRSKAKVEDLVNYKELIEYAWSYALKNCLNVYSISKNATYRNDPEKHFSAPYMKISYQAIQEGTQTCFDLGLIDYLCRTYSDFDPPRSLGYEPPVVEETDSQDEPVEMPRPLGEPIANPAPESADKTEEVSNPNLIQVVVSDLTLGALRELGQKLNMGVTVLASELLADKVAVIIVDYHNKKRTEALLK